MGVGQGRENGDSTTRRLGNCFVSSTYKQRAAEGPFFTGTRVRGYPPIPELAATAYSVYLEAAPLWGSKLLRNHSFYDFSY